MVSGPPSTSCQFRRFATYHRLLFIYSFKKRKKKKIETSLSHIRAWSHVHGILVHVSTKVNLPVSSNFSQIKTIPIKTIEWEEDNKKMGMQLHQSKPQKCSEKFIILITKRITICDTLTTNLWLGWLKTSKPCYN